MRVFIVFVLMCLMLGGCARRKGKLTPEQEKQIRENLTMGGLGPGKDD